MARLGTSCERGFRMTPAPNSEVLAIISEPYFRGNTMSSQGDYTPEDTCLATRR